MLGLVNPTQYLLRQRGVYETQHKLTVELVEIDGGFKS